MRSCPLDDRPVSQLGGEPSRPVSRPYHWYGRCDRGSHGRDQPRNRSGGRRPPVRSAGRPRGARPRVSRPRRLRECGLPKRGSGTEQLLVTPQSALASPRGHRRAQAERSKQRARGDRARRLGHQSCSSCAAANRQRPHRLAAPRTLSRGAARRSHARTLDSGCDPRHPRPDSGRADQDPDAIPCSAGRCAPCRDTDGQRHHPAPRGGAAVPARSRLEPGVGREKVADPGIVVRVSRSSSHKGSAGALRGSEGGYHRRQCHREPALGQAASARCSGSGSVSRSSWARRPRGHPEARAWPDRPTEVYRHPWAQSCPRAGGRPRLGGVRRRRPRAPYLGANRPLGTSWARPSRFLPRVAPRGCTLSRTSRAAVQYRQSSTGLAQRGAGPSWAPFASPPELAPGPPRHPLADQYGLPAPRATPRVLRRRDTVGWASVIALAASGPASGAARSRRTYPAGISLSASLP